mmetsp:Transcript_30284/g.75855  ORF Transcript_30284/g.75855 Transcript_30284/m.75855 type:complete len:266 (-) Transcript_30284:309-1106(-)
MATSLRCFRARLMLGPFASSAYLGLAARGLLPSCVAIAACTSPGANSFTCSARRSFYSATSSTSVGSHGDERGGAGVVVAPVAAATAPHPLDMDTFLAPFKNHERTGVPKGAGTNLGADGFDLSRMRRLLAALADPHLGYQVIHVAGTKGKGSTVGFIAAILRAAGYNTGTYKSPHVHSVAERIVCGPIHESGSGGGGGGGGTAGGTASETRRLAATTLVSDAAVDPGVAEIILRAQAAEGGALTYFEARTCWPPAQLHSLSCQL